MFQDPPSPVVEPRRGCLKHRTSYTGTVVVHAGLPSQKLLLECSLFHNRRTNLTEGHVSYRLASNKIPGSCAGLFLLIVKLRSPYVDFMDHIVLLPGYGGEIWWGLKPHTSIANVGDLVWCSLLELRCFSLRSGDHSVMFLMCCGSLGCSI